MLTLSCTCYSTYQMSVLGVWSNIEAHVGLWCACFPALQPILYAIFSILGIQFTGARSADRLNPNDPGGANTTGASANAATGGSGTGTARNRATTVPAIIPTKGGSNAYTDALSDSDSQKHMIPSRDSAAADEVEMQNFSTSMTKLEAGGGHGPYPAEQHAYESRL